MDKWIKKINTSPSAKKKSISNSVFGGSLANLDYDPKTNVPLLVANICRYIEKKGFHLEGIFRVNGSAKLIEKYKNLFCLSNGHELTISDNKDPGYDIHALAGLLKLFLRELKDGVIPEKYTSDIIKIFPDFDEKRCIKGLICLIKKIPVKNLHLLKYITKFLCNVLKEETKNFMSSKSLGIIFGPCIFKCCISPHGLKIQGFFNHLMTIFLTYYEQIFEEEFQSALDGQKRKTSFKSLPHNIKQNLTRRESVGILIDCTRNNSSSTPSTHLPPSSSLFDLAASMIRSRTESLTNSKEASRQDLCEGSPKEMNNKTSSQINLGCKNVPILAKDIASIITNISQSTNFFSLDSCGPNKENGPRVKKLSYPFAQKMEDKKVDDDLADEVWQVMLVGTEKTFGTKNEEDNSKTDNALTPFRNNDTDLKNFLMPPKNKYDHCDEESRDNSISLNITPNSDQGNIYLTPAVSHTEKSDESNDKMEFDESIANSIIETRMDGQTELESSREDGRCSKTPSSSSSSSSSTSKDLSVKCCKHDEGSPRMSANQTFIHHSFSMGLKVDDTSSVPRKADEPGSDSTPASLEEFSLLLEQVLDEQRNRCNRPKNIEEMTWDQVEKEKTDLQKGLLYFERLYGHPNNYHSKRIMKSFYDRYRIVKKLVAIHNSQKKTICQRLPMGHIAVHQSIQGSSPSSPIIGQLVLCQHQNQDSINVSSKISDDVKESHSMKFNRSGNNTQLKSSSDYHRREPSETWMNKPEYVVLLEESDNEFSQRILTLNKAGLHHELDKYLSHKVRIQRKLCSFEAFIEKSCGRKPNKTDRDECRKDYNNYRVIKLRIAQLNRLLEDVVGEASQAYHHSTSMTLQKSSQSSSGRSTNKENTYNNNINNTNHNVLTLSETGSNSISDKILSSPFVQFNDQESFSPGPNATSPIRPIVHLRRKKVCPQNLRDFQSGQNSPTTRPHVNTLSDPHLVAIGRMTSETSNPPPQLHQHQRDHYNNEIIMDMKLIGVNHQQNHQRQNAYRWLLDEATDGKMMSNSSQLHYFQQQRNPIDQRKVFCLYEKNKPL